VTRARLFLATALVLAASGDAMADGASPGTPDRGPHKDAPPGAASRADSLFAEGKALLEQGKYTDACPKLAESQRLDPATGTLLALGLCHESEGKTATAWRELQKVAEASERGGRSDRAKLARQHIAAIEPTLSKLVITVPDAVAKVAGLEVERDGEVVAPEEWNRPVAVDPGEHVVGAIATGKKRWMMRVALGPKGDTRVVLLPALADAGPAAAPLPAPAPPASDAPVPPVAASPAPEEQPAAPPGQGRRTVGYVVGAAGLVAVGVGTYFGVSALGSSSSAKAACPTAPNCTNPAAVSQNNDAKSAAWIADIGIGLGVVGIAVGAYLVLSAPKDAPPPPGAIHLLPRIGREGAAVSLEGAF
jgi:hypothetical protein